VLGSTASPVSSEKLGTEWNPSLPGGAAPHPGSRGRPPSHFWQVGAHRQFGADIRPDFPDYRGDKKGMAMNGTDLIQYTLYLLVLMNPISKIFILSVLAEQFSHDAMRKLIVKSTLFAWGILLVLGVGGNLVLDKIFHVQLYSLKTAAGIILFFVGYHALSKGVFFEVDEKQKPDDISLVPLASPMIAGPATITAAISLNTEHGYGLTFACVSLAIFINLFIMLLYRCVTSFMARYQIMGALVRITVKGSVPAIHPLTLDTGSAGLDALKNTHAVGQ